MFPIYRVLVALLIVVFLGFGSSFAYAQATEIFTAKVTRVFDGDTIEVLTSQKNTLRVRLAEIDAPERDQPFGQESKKSLSELLLNKQITLVKLGVDNHGRVLGRVFRTSGDASWQMVRQGNAWAYDRYISDQAFLGLEKKAQETKSGLWALDASKQEQPETWRHEHEAEKKKVGK